MDQLLLGRGQGMDQLHRPHHHAPNILYQQWSLECRSVCAGGLHHSTTGLDMLFHGRSQNGVWRSRRRRWRRHLAQQRRHTETKAGLCHQKQECQFPQRFVLHSSLTTVAPATAASVQELEITETEDDDDDVDVSDIFGHQRRSRRLGSRNELHQQRDVLINTPGGYNCHYYRPHDAMLYTAHVRDCRAVMLGSAPPRTIKVHKGESSEDYAETSDDYLSNDSSFDESEGYSSCEGDSNSSNNPEEAHTTLGNTSTETNTSTSSTKTSESSLQENQRYLSYMHQAGK